MKCRNCIYYRSGYMENECLAFDWYNFRTDGECTGVDNNFNLVEDDMGNKIFESKEDVFKRLKNGWRKLDLTKERYIPTVKEMFPHEFIKDDIDNSDDEPDEGFF